MKYRALSFGLAVVVAACGSASPSSNFGNVPDAAPVDAGKGQGEPDGSILTNPTDASTGDTSTNDDPPTPVDVVLTADNAYAFGWGTKTGLTTLKGRPQTQSAGDIFNCPVNTSGSGAIGFGPESYLVPASEAPPGSYLYVVVWDDDAVTQGLLGQFKRQGGKALYTGEGAWEVCATGKPYNTNDPATAAGPALSIVNADVDVCNQGKGAAATTSVGWVNSAGAVTPGAVGKLAVGEDNSQQDGSFPITCQKDANKNPGIDPASKWMWYTPDGRDAFTSRGTLSYLIFRLAATALPPPPPPK